jgi:hypothetical protein
MKALSHTARPVLVVALLTAPAFGNEAPAEPKSKPFVAFVVPWTGSTLVLGEIPGSHAGLGQYTLSFGYVGAERAGETGTFGFAFGMPWGPVSPYQSESNPALGALLTIPTPNTQPGIPGFPGGGSGYGASLNPGAGGFTYGGDSGGPKM